jgi:hypothetical protein
MTLAALPWLIGLSNEFGAEGATPRRTEVRLP